ncbi:hypothetical protein BV113_00540 [Glutamicibacter phage BIM BV-113]|nr:hypothetical protein BV113_00540 [Glutamicibacter phage BIM BV-113]
MRFYDGSELLIQNGALNVTGSATISGVLNVSGQTNLSGQVSVTGPMNITGTTTIGGNTSITGELVVTGPTTLDGITDIGGDTTITGQLSVTGPTDLDGLLTINGDTTITGLLDITGDTTVDGNFEITAGGLFKSGETTIEPTGKATFGDFVIDPSSNKLIDSPAGWVFTTGPDSIGLASSLTSSLNLNSDKAELNYPGSIVRASNGRIDLNTAKVWINGELEVSTTTRLKTALLYLSASLPTVTYQPNLYVHTDGRVYRSTWTPPTP